MNLNNVRSFVKYAFLFPLVNLVACGPVTRTVVRFDKKPMDKKELKQTKDGLTVELSRLTNLPPEFVTQAPTCNTAGGIYTDPQTGEQHIVDFYVIHWNYGQDILRVIITNSTDQILRLNRAAVKLTDPAGNDYELQSKEDAIAIAASAKTCVPGAGTAEIVTIKLFDKNVEIMPQSTWKGYAVFSVPTSAQDQTGTWKYSFYELPVMVDDTGKVTNTMHFKVHYVTKKFIDTFQRDNVFAQEKLVSSKESE